jgi:hypothetical protein
MPRNPKDRCDLSWEQRFGTTVAGNLPQYKINTCIKDTVNIATVQIEAPWVSLDDFHYHHIKCPYSTESSNHVIIRRVIGSDWQTVDVENEAVNHTATSGIMIKHSRGSKYGWLCVDPECPYYNGTVSGTTTSGTWYFYC